MNKLPLPQVIKSDAQESTVQLSRIGKFLKRIGVSDPRLMFRLAVGPVLLLVAGWTFAAIAEDVVTQEPIVEFDRVVVNAFHANTDPRLIDIMYLISTVGREIPTVVTLGLIIYFIIKRRKYDLILLVVTIGGAQLVNQVFKAFFQRTRPLFTDPVASAGGFSFPSGHSMGAMVFYGLMAYYLIHHKPGVARRVTVIIVFTVIVTLVGFSRIYLGVHFPSDVVGGYVAGVAWLALMVSDVQLYRFWIARRKRRALRKAMLLKKAEETEED